MNEILFKVRNTKTNKWELFNIGDNLNKDLDYDSFRQYTGLWDKNSKKIFEGDIIEFYTNVRGDVIKDYWKDCFWHEYDFCYKILERKDQAIVQWNWKKGLWDLKVYNNKRYKRKAKLFGHHQFDYEIIGNIYDNHEIVNK